MIISGPLGFEEKGLGEIFFFFCSYLEGYIPIEEEKSLFVFLKSVTCSLP